MNPIKDTLTLLRVGVAAVALSVAAGGAFAQEETPAGTAETTEAQEVAPDTVVATVNGEPITEAQIDLALADLGQQFAGLPEEQQRAAALSALIEIMLFAAEAEEQGLGDSETFQQRMDLLRQRALHSAYIENAIAAEVTDEAVRQRYETELAGVEPEQEVRARHIIVETEEEARAIIEELEAGGNFEEIAKEKSTDGAAAQGGDLGYFGKGQMVPEFEEAVFALEVGEYTQEPVQTQFGWHVIKLEDKRDREPPAFEDVSAQIRSLMLREQYMETASSLREAAEIEIEDPALQGVLEGATDTEAAEPAEGEEPAAGETEAEPEADAATEADPEAETQSE